MPLWWFDKRLRDIRLVIKKVVSDSMGLVDFAVGLVNSVLNLSDGQVIFGGKIHIKEEL